MDSVDDFDSMADMAETTPEEDIQVSDTMPDMDGTIQEDEDPADTISDISGTMQESESVSGTLSDISETIPEVSKSVPATPDTPLASRSWQPGDVIEEIYEVKGSAEGAMGKVYFVHHKNWNTMLAMKTPHANVYASEKGKADYIREAESWIEIGMHPNVVSAFYVRNIDDIPRIFLEYVDGGDLRSWMKEDKVKDIKTILDIAVQVSEGMEQAHRKDLIHRDLKPENIMMTQDGSAKVTDLGLAAAESTSGGGTPLYMSPEQWTRDSSVGTAADIYAFGCILYEMLTDRLVFQPAGADKESRKASLKEQHCEATPDPLPDAISVELKDFVMSCLAKDASSRPQSFEPMSDRLRGIYQAVVGEEYPREEPNEVELLADGLNNRALSMLDLGRKEEAEALFSEALGKDTQHLDATYNRGLLRWRNAKIADDVLVADLRKLSLTKRQSELNRLIGYVHMERLDIPEAIRAFQSSLDLDQNSGDLPGILEEANSGLSEAWACVGTVQAFPDQKYIKHVSISTNGELIATGGKQDTHRLHESDDGDSGVKVWRLPSCELIYSQPSCTWDVNSVEILDNQYVLYTIDDSYIDSVGLEAERSRLQIVDIRTGVIKVDIKADPSLFVDSLVVSEEAGFFVTSGWDDKSQAIRIWNCHAGELVTEISDAKADYLAISNDGSIMLSAEKYSNQLIVWDVNRRKKLVEVQNEGNDSITCIAISADGKYGFVGESNQTITMWELAAGRLNRTFKGHHSDVTALAVAQDTSLFVSGSGDKTVRVWDIETGRCMRTFHGHANGVRDVAISSDAGSCVSGDYDGDLKVWNLEGRATQSVYVLSTIDDSSSLVSKRDLVAQLIDAAKACMRNGQLADGYRSLVKVRSVDGYEHDEEVSDLVRQCARKGRRIGFLNTYSKDGLLKSYPLNSRNAVDNMLPSPEPWSFAVPIIEMFERTGRIENVAVSPDSQEVFYARNVIDGKGGVAVLEVMASGSEILEIPIDNHYSDSCVCAISRDLLKGVTVEDSTGRWRLWDLKTGVNLQSSAQQEDSDHGGLWYMDDIQFTPDEMYLVAGGTSQACHSSGPYCFGVKIWSICDGRLLMDLPEVRGPISLAGNKKYIAVSKSYSETDSMEHVARVWDIEARSFMTELVSPATQARAMALQFTSDSQYIIAGLYDGTIAVWRVSDGELLFSWEADHHPAIFIRLSPDNQFLLTLHQDIYKKANSSHLWQLDWDYEFPARSDWDEGAKPYMEAFLTLFMPYATDGFSRCGRPSWTEEEFQELLKDLQHRGYGWLSPEGVHRKLEEMAANWTGPPPLFEDQS